MENYFIQKLQLHRAVWKTEGIWKNFWHMLYMYLKVLLNLQQINEEIVLSGWSPGHFIDSASVGFHTLRETTGTDAQMKR